MYHEIKIHICWNSQYLKNVFPRRCIWHSQKLLPGMFGLVRAGHVADYTTEDGQKWIISIVTIPKNARSKVNSNHSKSTLRDQSMLWSFASFMCNLVYTNKSFVIAHDNLQIKIQRGWWSLCFIGSTATIDGSSDHSKRSKGDVKDLLESMGMFMGPKL